jgi:Flp pilus assembly protein TadG
VFSIIECSLALYDKAVITNASREAARAGIVLRTPKLSKTQIANVASNYCQNNLISFANNTSPTILVKDNGTNTFGTPLSVSVYYVYTGLGFGQLINALSGPITLSAITTMNNE